MQRSRNRGATEDKSSSQHRTDTRAAHRYTQQCQTCPRAPPSKDRWVRLPAEVRVGDQMLGVMDDFSMIPAEYMG